MYDKSTDYVIAQWLEQQKLPLLIMCMLQENHNKSKKKKSLAVDTRQVRGQFL